MQSCSSHSQLLGSHNHHPVQQYLFSVASVVATQVCPREDAHIVAWRNCVTSSSSPLHCYWASTILLFCCDRSKDCTFEISFSSWIFFLVGFDVHLVLRLSWWWSWRYTNNKIQRLTLSRLSGKDIKQTLQRSQSFSPCSTSQLKLQIRKVDLSVSLFREKHV